MSSMTLNQMWVREMGATSRGMMFLGGSFATAGAMRSADGQARPDGAVEETGGPLGLLGAVLAAALMVVPALGLMAAGSGQPGSRASGRIVDVPAITVRPSAADAEAFRHSRRIVELDAMVVHPREADRAFHLAMRESAAAPLASVDAQP